MFISSPKTKNIIFKLTLDEGKLEVEYSKTFKLLSEAVSLTNRSKVKKLPKFKKQTFEPKEKTDVMRQSVFLDAQRPIWLPSPEILQVSIKAIIQAFENVGEMEVLKIRWEEIKKLNHQTLVVSG